MYRGDFSSQTNTITILLLSFGVRRYKSQSRINPVELTYTRTLGGKSAIVDLDSRIGTLLVLYITRTAAVVVVSRNSLNTETQQQYNMCLYSSYT
jgi:hypothetical protein